MSPNIVDLVKEIEEFKSNYKSNINKKVTLGEYVDFLNEYRGMALKIAIFCNENISIFNQLLGSKNLQL